MKPLLAILALTTTLALGCAKTTPLSVLSGKQITFVGYALSKNEYPRFITSKTPELRWFPDSIAMEQDPNFRDEEKKATREELIWTLQGDADESTYVAVAIANFKKLRAEIPGSEDGTRFYSDGTFERPTGIDTKGDWVIKDSAFLQMNNPARPITYRIKLERGFLLLRPDPSKNGHWAIFQIVPFDR